MQTQPAYKVVVLDDDGNWQTLRTCATYEEGDALIDVYTDRYPCAIIDLLEIPPEANLTP